MASNSKRSSSGVEKNDFGGIGCISTYYKLQEAEEKVLIQWCMDKGLIAAKYDCPKCNQGMVLTPRLDKGDKYVWVCRQYGQNAHYAIKSIRVGSWFENSRMSISKILLFLIYWCVEMKRKFVIEELDIASGTATDWASFCREICLDVMIWRSEKIGGPGVIVEIDESELGERRNYRGKTVIGRWVFGGVERSTNDCFFKVVENRTSEALLSVIKEHVLPGSTVISDCWASYNCLVDEGFVHLKVNQDIHFIGPNTGTHTNSNEGKWNAIKKSQCSNHVKGQFDSYLATYMWKRKYSSAESRMSTLIDMIKEISKTS